MNYCSQNLYKIPWKKNNMFFVLSDIWRVSPIAIHDRKSVLNKNHIKLSGTGKTIYLLCTSSTLFQQESSKVNI